AFRGPGRAAPERVHQDGARHDADEHPRCVRRGRRAGLGLSASGDGGGNGVHGGARSRTLPRARRGALNVRDELAELAGELRAHAEWQIESGATGLPAAEKGARMSVKASSEAAADATAGARTSMSATITPAASTSTSAGAKSAT